MVGYRRQYGFNRHTRTTRRIVVEGQLRHDWDLLRLLGSVLRKLQVGGGAASVRLLPGEHYFLCRLVLRIERRARKRLADEAHLWSGNAKDPPDEQAVRAEWLRTAPLLEPDAEYPVWHREALAAVDRMAEHDQFRVLAIRHGMYDRAAEADLEYRDPETGRPIE